MGTTLRCRWFGHKPDKPRAFTHQQVLLAGDYWVTGRLAADSLVTRLAYRCRRTGCDEIILTMDNLFCMNLTGTALAVRERARRGVSTEG